MITLSPINKDIRETLDKKSAMLKAGAGRDIYKDDDGKWGTLSINTPITEEGRIQKNYMFSRTPFLRMVSTVPKNDDDEAIVLLGGELSSLGRLRSGFKDREAPVNVEISSDESLDYKGLYSQPDETLIDDIPYRPLAGVKDISIEYKGGGMRLGSTRSADISWTCWDYSELDRFRPHFLHHGIHVLLEWGWSAPGIDFSLEEPFYDVFESDTLKFNKSKLENIQEKLIDHTLKQKGNYDAMIGLVTNFSWSVNEDGGFNCTTKLISQGVTLFQKMQKPSSVLRSATLPLFAKQKKNPKNTLFGSLWTADDYITEYGIGEEGAVITVENVAPYISIQEYMSDFPIQVWDYLRDLDAEGKSHLTAHGMKVFRVYALDYEGRLMADTFGHHVSGILGAGLVFAQQAATDYNETKPTKETLDEFTKMTDAFVSWGWFEDNVLSRFFGTVQGKELIGEFRSIESAIDNEGNLLKMDEVDVSEDGRFRGAKEGQQIYESTKMTNSRFLITVDTAKWLIPNPNDPVFQHLMMYQKQDFHDSKIQNYHTGFGGTDRTGIFHPTGKDGAVDSNGEPDKDNQFYRLKRNRFAKYPIIDGVEDTNEAAIRSGYIRNVYFNCHYLKEKFKNSGDIIQSVMSVWEDFSTQYGGVYKFKIEFGDDGKKAMVVEEGYTGQSVGDTLRDADKRKSVYEFPAFSNDSFVKSQNISAKLPDRMKNAAMFGKASKSDDPEAEGNLSVNDGYEDLVSKTWGKFVEPIPSDTTGMSDDEIKQQRYADMMGGKIEFPSRKNRYFGQVMADPNEPISIGKFDDEGKGKAVKGDGKGIQIQDTILNEIMAIQKKELFDQLAVITGLEADSKKLEETVSTEALNTQEAQMEVFKNLSSYRSQDMTEEFDESWHNFYDMASSKGLPKLKSTFHWTLQSLLRGNFDGVLKRVDSLIPIDFEMDIDGVGGIFPGNSFHSSYLPIRYKENSLFQVVGASHKIDSDGWTTTIKGQIRAKSDQANEEIVYGEGDAPANPTYDPDEIMNDPNLSDDEKLAKIAELRANGFVSNKSTFANKSAAEIQELVKVAKQEYNAELVADGSISDLGKYVGTVATSAEDANMLFIEQGGLPNQSFEFDGVTYVARDPSIEGGFFTIGSPPNVPSAGFGGGEGNYYSISAMAQGLGVNQSVITTALTQKYPQWDGNPTSVQAGWSIP
tara:strand:- start:611 stop:4174 length:3564 start_codon:yes stop_codon:yes gene_type:complete